MKAPIAPVTWPENVHGRKQPLLPQLHFHGKPSRLSPASQTTLPPVLAMRAVLTMMVSWPCWPCRSGSRSGPEALLAVPLLVAIQPLQPQVSAVSRREIYQAYNI